MDTAEKIAAWSAFAVAVFGVIGKWVFDYMKTQQKTLKGYSKLDYDQINFIINQYKALAAELKDTVSTISDRMEELNQEHIACREENAKMQMKITFLEEANKEMQKRLGTLERDNVK